MNDEPVLTPTATLPPVQRSMKWAVPDDVRKYQRSLPRRGPTRRLAEAITEGFPIPQDCIGPVASSLTDPGKKSWKQDLVAIWSVGRAAAAGDRYHAAGWLSHVLERWPSLDQWPRLRRSYTRTMCFLYMMVGLLSFRSGSVPLVLWFMPSFGAIPLSVLAYPISSYVDRRRLNRNREEAAKGLGMLQVPHSAATLAGAAFDRDVRVRTAAHAALLNVLPSVTPEQYGLLQLETTPRLCSLLAHYDPLLVSAALGALRSIGDSRAIRPVERLARRGGHAKQLPSGLAAEVEQTLVVLRARQKREIEAASLLRPTVNPASPEESLLRPHVETGDQASEVLLRATNWTAEGTDA